MIQCEIGMSAVFVQARESRNDHRRLTGPAWRAAAL